MLISSLIDFVLGTVLLDPGERTGELLGKLVKFRIHYEIIFSENDERIKVRYTDYKRLKSNGKENLSYVAGSMRGIPYLFKKYGMRSGLAAAAVFLIMLVSVSQKYVWRIDVKGNKTIPADEIIENLETLGFSYGTDFSKLDFDVLHNEYLLKYDDLAWISVNMYGTWASVEVKEMAAGEEYVKKSGASNVVSTEGGKVVMIEALDGKPVVRVGDFVSEGELLITGVIAVGEEGLRFVPAHGRVFAEVRREFCIEIPKKSIKRSYTGDEISEKELIFFKKGLKVSGNSRISYNKYDKIYKKEQIFLNGTVPLPLFTSETVYREYTETEREVSKSEAEIAFKDLYASRLSEALCGAQLTSVEFTDGETDDFYVRNYRIGCIADIAKEAEITID